MSSGQSGKSMIIVGGGIAGLAAGCYGQMNGYDTQIFEQHTSPGGLCTSWKRGGYTFDGCIHWLVGTNPQAEGNRLWQELGATAGRQFINHAEFGRVENADGKALIVYTDVDRLEQHLKELAPNDSKKIEEMTRAIRLLGRMDMPLDNPMEGKGFFGGLGQMFTMLPLMRAFSKWGKISIQDYTKGFSDPFVREALLRVFDLPDFPMAMVLMTLGGLDAKNAGYPLGGSLKFSEAIANRYLGLGGTICYRSKIAKILVENDTAVGIQLADGSEYRGDIVISAADGHATLFDMLEDRYTPTEVREYYRSLPIFKPIVQISLGVAADLSNEPHTVQFALREPLEIAGQMREYLNYKHFCYDPALTPQGKSAIVVMIESDYDYWLKLYEGHEQYEAEKLRVAEIVMEQLSERLPELKDKIEVIDVATPITTQRFTGNWRGSIEGWMFTTKNFDMAMGNGMSKTLPQLNNFYMAGQWVQPGGGVPGVAISGRELIKLICKQDGKKFLTTTG